MARLHVGCAMWTHKAWAGRFLPQSLPAKGVEAEMRAFLDAIEPLGERAVLWTHPVTPA